MINILVAFISSIVILALIWAFFNPGWMEGILDGKGFESFSISYRKIVFKARVIKNRIARFMKYIRKHLFPRALRAKKVKGG